MVITKLIEKAMNDETKKKIELLGYNDDFESERKALGLTDFGIARVIAEHKELYRVKDINNEFWSKVTGKQMFNAKGREDYPAVGDWVAIAPLDGEKSVIQAILPRKTILKKKYNNKEGSQIIAANIDFAFIIESIDRDYNLNRFERYMVLANEGKIQPVVVLNKIDLITKDELVERIEELKGRFPDVDIIPTSVVTDGGLDKLTEYIKEGKTYCFLGSSGVGKSSLINKLLQANKIKTEQISQYSGRGKHTTTAREMYFLKDGGILIDNPGVREVGVIDSEEGIKNIFEEIGSLSRGCRYSDCTHTNEPGCAVLGAVENEELDEQKYGNYIKLKKESDFYKMSNLEKREKDRKFGKFIKNSLDQMKKYEK